MTSAQQRAELQRQIWEIANQVRGSVDGWDSMQYAIKTKGYSIYPSQLVANVAALTKITKLRTEIDVIVADIGGDTA